MSAYHTHPSCNSTIHNPTSTTAKSFVQKLTFTQTIKTFSETRRYITFYHSLRVGITQSV